MCKLISRMRCLKKLLKIIFMEIVKHYQNTVESRLASGAIENHYLRGNDIQSNIFERNFSFPNILLNSVLHLYLTYSYFANLITASYWLRTCFIFIARYMLTNLRRQLCSLRVKRSNKWLYIAKYSQKTGFIRRGTTDRSFNVIATHVYADKQPW